MQTTRLIPYQFRSSWRAHTGLAVLGLRLLVLLGLSGLWVASTPFVRAQSTPQVTTPQVDVTALTELTARDNGFGFEYAVPNGPRNLVADSVGRIWFTSPQSDGIGVVTVTSDVDDPLVQYQVEFYSFAPGTEPYDIDFGNGFIWFSLHGANALGSIDINTRTINFYALPSANGRPTGIDFGGDGQVWIALNNARIASFNPNTTQFFEFLFPDSLSATPEVEDIVYQNSRSIWFTMPTANVVAIYNSITDRFFTIPTGQTGPSGIVLDPNGRPWVTAIDSSRIGRFIPTTVSTWVWYDTPTPNSRPARLVVFDSIDRREVWVTQSAAGSAGRIQLLDGFNIVKREAATLANPTGEPWGITLGTDKHIWIADTGRNLLYELTPPYIYTLYMSIVQTPASVEEPAPSSLP